MRNSDGWRRVADTEETPKEGDGMGRITTATGDIPLLRRGVWQADFFGPDGELVLIALNRQRRLVAPPLVVAHGESRIAAADRLLNVLDRADPVPNIRIV